MKTKEIIEQLQYLDPSGELECSADGNIVEIIIAPGYYDGPQEIITGRTRGKYNYSNSKIIFYSQTFRDKFDDHAEDFEIDYSDLPELKRTEYIKKDEQYRSQIKKLEQELSLNLLISYIHKHLMIDLTYITDVCKNFVKQNPIPYSPPKLSKRQMTTKGGEIIEYWPSINDRYAALFMATLNYYYISNKLIICFKYKEGWNIQVDRAN